jgi:hypothetical protein
MSVRALTVDGARTVAYPVETMHERARVMRAAAAVFGGALVLAGCQATVFYTQLVPPPHAMAPHRVEDVEVLVVTPPVAPHVDVGLLQVTTGDGARTSTQMVARLRAEAAALGCDALLITGVENQAGRYSRPSMQGSCVVYKTPQPATVGKS